MVASEPMASCVSYILIGEPWLATHCHFPPDISIQVSVQRSWASTAFPLSSVPLPTQSPVAIAVFPNTVTFTLLISFLSHFAALTLASVSALPVTFPSLSVLMNLSARSGAIGSGLLALDASAHFCSSAATACSVPPPIFSCACATTISESNATTPHTSFLFIACVLHSVFRICVSDLSTLPSGAIDHSTWLAMLPRWISATNVVSPRLPTEPFLNVCRTPLFQCP